MPEILMRSNQDRPATGIIHLGPGAFFRAFGAVYTAGAIQAHGGDWGIQAVSLRSPDIRDKLQPQGYAYTSVTCLLYTSPSPRDGLLSRMPSSA